MNSAKYIWSKVTISTWAKARRGESIIFNILAVAELINVLEQSPSLPLQDHVGSSWYYVVARFILAGHSTTAHQMLE
jgi:hypothetical protein